MIIGQPASLALKTTLHEAEGVCRQWLTRWGSRPNCIRRQLATAVDPRTRVDEARIITAREPPSVRSLCHPSSPPTLPPERRLALHPPGAMRILAVCLDRATTARWSIFALGLDPVGLAAYSTFRETLAGNYRSLPAPLSEPTSALSDRRVQAKGRLVRRRSMFPLGLREF